MRLGVVRDNRKDRGDNHGDDRGENCRNDEWRRRTQRRRVGPTRVGEDGRAGVGLSERARPVGLSERARPVGLSERARPVGLSERARPAGEKQGASLARTAVNHCSRREARSKSRKDGCEPLQPQRSKEQVLQGRLLTIDCSCNHVGAGLCLAFQRFTCSSINTIIIECCVSSRVLGARTRVLEYARLKDPCRH